jgi:hypothetical protein
MAGRRQLQMTQPANGKRELFGDVISAGVGG